MIRALAVLALAATPARAGVCEDAIRAIGSVTEAPPALLRAVALVESGTAGVSRPWVINVAGQERTFRTQAEAMAAVTTLQAAGVQSIDVGCMQINLRHHPAAFATLQDAFTPSLNVAYGARFLTSLFHEVGSWDGAAAAYHSRTPAIGAAYRTRVLALWQPAAAAPSPSGLDEAIAADRDRGRAARLALVGPGPALTAPRSSQAAVRVAAPAPARRVWARTPS